MKQNAIFEKPGQLEQIQAEVYGTIKEVQAEADAAAKQAATALQPIHVRIAAQDYFVKKECTWLSSSE